jgi:biotin carboxylase
MQEVLKSAGLRCIRSSVVCSEEEAVSFYRQGKGERVVIKPTQAAGSVGVFICGSESEVRRAYRINNEFVKQRNRKEEKTIIQQYIDGEEYVVDTLSCEGRHAALFGMKYNKRMCEGFGKIYDTDIYLSADDAAIKELVDYCFRVLSCLGVRYGAVHSEFMIDERGPVLIEVNARPAGSFQKYSFQDKIMENHETAAALDSYFMSPEQFFARYPERMHLKQPAAVKQICLKEDIYVEKVKITERLSGLESFEYAIEIGENCVYPKTTDLDSNGGIIYLTAPDSKIIEKDLNEILKLEKEGLDELFDWHRT